MFYGAAQALGHSRKHRATVTQHRATEFQGRLSLDKISHLTVSKFRRRNIGRKGSRFAKGRGAMTKLPVFGTFGNAFGFAFTNFFTCFRLAWLPFSLLIIASQAVAWYVTDKMVSAVVTDPEPTPHIVFQQIFQHMDRFALLQGTLMILQAIVIAAVAVSIHRVILFGDRRPNSYLNFAFGKTEILYLLMTAIMLLLVMTLMAVILTPTIYALANGDFTSFFSQFEKFPQNMPNLMASGTFGVLMFAYLAGWIIVVFFMLRLAVWPPSVVATGRLSPSEAWNLTQGNAWRIIGLFVLTGIAIDFILLSIFGVGMANGGFEMLQHMKTMRQTHNPLEMREAIRDGLQSYLPLIFVLYLCVAIFFTSLGVALVTYAYKALKGYHAVDPIPS